MREKLVELLEKFVPEDCDENRHPMCDDIRCSECIAERLIANGVTIQRERGDIDLTRTTVLEAGDVASGRVMARSDLAELEKAMERLGRFGELFVDHKGCSRGPMGRAGGVTLEEEVLLMPKITDADGGEWIPVNAEALHELVERSRKLREERRWISVTERLPDTIPCGAGTEYSEAVNVLTDGRKVLTAIWNGSYWICDAEFWDAEFEEITHWTPVLLPLPQPPEGDNNG